MPTGKITSTVSVGGIEFASSVSRTAAGQVSHSTVIPAGIAGVKNSSTTVNGLVTGHGLVGTDVVDMHWTDPTDGIQRCRRGITIDTANANDIVFDETPAPLGDSLPANDTAVVLSKRVTIDTDWDGDLLEMIALKATGRAVADFWDATVSLVAQKMEADQALDWVSNQGVANPYTGNPVSSIKVSNGTVAAVTFTMGALYRSV